MVFGKKYVYIINSILKNSGSNYLTNNLFFIRLVEFVLIESTIFRYPMGASGNVIGNHSHTGELFPQVAPESVIENPAIAFSLAIENEILSALHRVPNAIVSEKSTMQFLARIINRVLELLGEDISIVPVLTKNGNEAPMVQALNEYAFPIIQSLKESYPDTFTETVLLPLRLQAQPLLTIGYPKNKLHGDSDHHLIRSSIQAVVDMLSEKYIAGQKELENLEMAMMDPLLQIPGRRALDKVIGEYQRLSNIKNKFPVSVLIIDLDHFKNVNDTHGHNIGDQILKHVTALIYSDCELISLQGNQTQANLYRMGGEELACIITNCTPDQALLFAQSINRKLRSSPFFMNDEIAIYQTASIGIATATSIHDFKSVILADGSEGGTKVLKYADLALYSAKESRDTVVPFSEVHLSLVHTLPGERRSKPRKNN